jgi:hypothetical protein
MQNNPQSNAPIQCKCSSGCIATMHVVVVAHKEVVVSEADVCSTSLDDLGRTLRLLPNLSWSATKITSRAIPMPRAAPDDQTRPVIMDADITTALDPNNAVDAVGFSSAIVSPIDEETSGVHDVGIDRTPLPLVEDESTRAVQGQPLNPMVRIYVLKRLVEAFDEAVGLPQHDMSMDRKIAVEADLGARHLTLPAIPVSTAPPASYPNAHVFVMNDKTVLHVYRFESFRTWFESEAQNGFVNVADWLERLDEKLHAGAYKLLRALTEEVQQRAPNLKTAFFQF